MLENCNHTSLAKIHSFFFFLYKKTILTPEVDGLRNWDFLTLQSKGFRLVQM